jgi:hypothetical protein
VNGWVRYSVDFPPGLFAKGEEPRAFAKGDCRVLVGREHRNGESRLRLHLSISRVDRYPNWDEIKAARYELLPLHLTFAMLLPPPGDYVNIHPNCFHLWEVTEL